MVRGGGGRVLPSAGCPSSAVVGYQLTVLSRKRLVARRCAFICAMWYAVEDLPFVVPRASTPFLYLLSSVTLQGVTG